jgi:uncharacterized protein (DUF1697 family)
LTIPELAHLASRRKLAPGMARQIALLRGINLGSRRRVAMAELRDLLNGLGYGDVRTLLQSGNVVLTSTAAPARLERELEAQIAAGLGVDVQVIVRTRDELADVIEHNPLAGVADDPRRYQVSFLSAEPDREIVRELVAADVAPEQVAVRGREIYAWHPEGIQRSALAKLISDPRLGVTATARNWNTVTKLLALADD